MSNAAMDALPSLREQVLSVAEALSLEDCDLSPDLDIVRVVNPSEDAWPDLRRSGFVVRPARITWRGSPPGDLESYLKGLSANNRRQFRLAMSAADRHGVTATEASRLSADQFAEFLTLYERCVGEMKRGLPVARYEQADILVKLDDHWISWLVRHKVAIGACLVDYTSDMGVCKVKFIVTSRPYRDVGFARLLYLKAFELAARLGAQMVSLGNDPNLYGFIVQPGLFRLKRGLGFLPEPLLEASPLDPAVISADKIMRLTTLSDPSVSVSYPANWYESQALQVTVWSTSTATDVRPFQMGSHGAPDLNLVPVPG